MLSVTLISPGFVESEIARVDNQGVLRDAARASAPSWLVMPTERAARQIVRAVTRRRREAVITGHAKLAVFLQRHAPWLVAWGVRAVAARRRRGAPGASDAPSPWARLRAVNKSCAGVRGEPERFARQGIGRDRPHGSAIARAASSASMRASE